MGLEAVRDGSVTEGLVESSPWAGALSRHLGAEEEVEVDYFGPFDLHEGGWLLLCSDGLHRVFSIHELEAILIRESDPEEAARRLVEEALERNTKDNVSVALMFRPGRTRDKAPSGDPYKGLSPWKPERLLIQPRRLRQKGRRRKPLAIRILWVVIPLLIGLGLALMWWFTSGTG